MESVFAGLGGFLLLNENLGLRGYIGCILMLSGMLLSQFKFNKLKDVD
jgi:drug/metabolite transporter (DMT)-like permease